MIDEEIEDVMAIVLERLTFNCSETNGFCIVTVTTVVSNDCLRKPQRAQIEH
jgi:hypothetical protein